MNLIKKTENNSLVISIEGRLDTITSPELEKEVMAIEENITEMVFDMSKLEYISSAGLRVVLLAHKRMSRRGSLVLTGVSETVMEVFEITGFNDILNIL